MVVAKVRVYTLEDEVELRTTLTETWVAGHRIEISGSLPSFLFVFHVGKVLAHLGVAIKADFLAGCVPLSK